MLPLKADDRVRVLSAVARKGASYQIMRIAVITASLAILVLTPILGIVRIDLWRHEHVLLGERVGIVSALQGFVVVLAVLYGVTFLTNMVVGRFFCGWGCPVGYVSRLGEEVAISKGRRRRVFAHLAGAGFVMTFVAAIMSWWVDPRVLIEGTPFAKGVTLGVFGVLWAGGFLHAFWWRFGFCVSVCPIGLYYRYVTSKAPVGILFSNVPTACIECGACEKVCPVDLDPKNLGATVAEGEGGERYGDAECLRCGDCVEACRLVFAKDHSATPPLRFGRVGSGDAAGV
jgi:ferredoxin-type protein NapH